MIWAVSCSGLFHDLGCFCALELVWAPALTSLARPGGLVFPHDMAMLVFVPRRGAFALLRCGQGVVCIARVWARAGLLAHGGARAFIAWVSSGAG